MSIRFSAAPFYQQIASELQQNIKDRVYRPGEQLPTEEQLALRFGVNRHTVRRAIGVLRAEGLLRVDQGRGTFVADTPIRYPIGKRVRYNATLRAQGREASTRLLRIVQVPADAGVARALAISTGDPVALWEVLGLADGDPVDVSTNYFPLATFPDILDHLPDLKSVSAMFQDRYQRDHLRRSTILTARPANGQDAPLLNIALNAPILMAEAVNVDQYDHEIQYGITRFRGDRMELVVENDLSLATSGS